MKPDETHRSPNRSPENRRIAHAALEDYIDFAGDVFEEHEHPRWPKGSGRVAGRFRPKAASILAAGIGRLSTSSGETSEPDDVTDAKAPPSGNSKGHPQGTSNGVFHRKALGPDGQETFSRPKPDEPNKVILEPDSYAPHFWSAGEAGSSQPAEVARAVIGNNDQSKKALRGTFDPDTGNLKLAGDIDPEDDATLAKIKGQVPEAETLQVVGLGGIYALPTTGSTPPAPEPQPEPKPEPKPKLKGKAKKIIDKLKAKKQWDKDDAQFSDGALVVQTTHSDPYPTEELAGAPVSEMAKWMEAKYPKINFDLQGIHPANANPAMAEFDRLATLYPYAVDRLRYVGGYKNPTNPKNNAGFQSKSTMAHASQDGRKIGLNPTFYKDKNKLADSTKSGAMTRFHPPGSEPTESVLTHEFGHHLLWGMRRALAATAPKKGMDPAIQKLNDLVNKDNTVIKEKGEHTVSSYAKQSADEMWAEAFTSKEYTPALQKVNHVIRFESRLYELHTELMSRLQAAQKEAA